MVNLELMEIIKQAFIKIAEALKAIFDAFKNFIRPIFTEFMEFKGLYQYKPRKIQQYKRDMKILSKKYIIPDKRNRVFYCRNNC